MSPSRPLSLRARLLAGMALVAAVLTVVAIVITATTRSLLIDQIDDRLVAGAADGRGDTFQGRDREGDDHIGAPRAGSPERQSDFYEGAIDQDGQLITFFVPNIGGEDFAPPDVTAEMVAADNTSVDGDLSFFTADAAQGDVHYRVLAGRPTNDGVTFLTALPLNDVAATIRRLVIVELLGVAAIMAVLGLVTWWMIRLGIRPIKQMTNTATEIAAGDLSARVEESSPAAESRDLAVALNTMLGTIERALDERAQSEGRLRRFVSDASHELRTPVTTIRGYAELYRVGGLTDKAALDDAMRRTEQESVRMSRLVDDMLQLAKLDEHRPLESRPIDLAELSQDAAADARVAAPERSITVDAHEPVIVSGDDDRLRQVFANLIGNAITHTSDHASIVIRVTADGPTGRVEIQDSGAGMPPEVAERVTERFFRADPSRSRDRGGSGLGLSIVDAVVEAHGGSITITSEPSRGTTVVVDIPLTT